MTCPNCGQAVPASARFCGACGTRVEATCPVCSTANGPGNRFCQQCGTPLSQAPPDTFASPRSYTPNHLAEMIRTSASALSGERKQVTVLFVDVSGFTSLSERLDPEEVHALMKRAFDLMLTEVHRYEGTVNQFLGDGIMALFGAPIAHEDHAQRAVHAALGIARALKDYRRELAPRGISFRARQGLNTGLVVVGSIGSDLRMDYTAVGDTTNVAARLQQATEPERVTISDATHRLIRGYFTTRPLGEIHLKGKTEPVAAWEVVAAHESRTRLEIESDHGLTSFVGREREVASLEAAFAQADGGHGQVVFVVGEPGIGKSRLLLELRRRIADRAAWQEGHCLSFGRAMAFHPLIDLLRRRFGIEEADDESTIVAKIDGALRELGDDVVSTAPYLRALLSVDPGDGAVRAMDPAQRRGETFEAVRRLFVRAAERRPQVLVIEDLHWIDSASEDFLAALVDSVPALRILVVFTYRPGYANRFGERSYFTRIVPAALTPDDTARMAAAVLAADDVPASLRALVSEKAEGNPFYVEELVKSLAESGALQQGLAGRAIPDTIHDVIAARIDRLADAPKRTLQLAAVVGREFTRRIVERLAEVGGRTDELMRELTSLELIHERRRYPELAYMFKHALTQDVAYDSLLVQRRKELHALVGRAIEELYADRPAEHYEMLAHHFSKAEEWERALDYQLKAADKARRAFGLRQALELYGGALDAARHLSERVPVGTILEIHRARADLYFAVGDFGRSREEADVLVAMSARVGDRRAEADALMLAATAWQWYEDFPRARENARRAIDIARAVGAPEAESGALAVLGYMRSLNGLMDEGRDQLDRSLAIARRVGDAARETYVLQLLSMMRGWQGDYRGSLALSDEGLTIARTHGLAPGYLRNLWNRGLAFNDLGDYDAALRALTEGLALAEKIGDDAFIPRYLNTIGWLRIEAGDLTGGIALSERAYEATERSSRAGHGTGAERRAFIRNNEADAFMARGDFAAAAAAIDESHHTVLHPPPSRWMTWRYGTHCHASRGQLALLRGDADGARRCADESLEIATATRSRKFESWAWRIKGESATMRHAWPEAEEALRRALAIAESIHHPRQTWLAHGALGRLQDGLGRRDDADASYAAAVQLIAAARLRANDPGVRTGLETLPAIRVIEDRASRSSR